MRSTSARVSTVGSRGGRLARSSPWSHASSRPSTSLYRNSSAESAWFLRGGRDLALSGEMIQERRDFRLAQLQRMPPPRKEDEAPDPVQVRLFRAAAEIAPADRLVHLHE
jgi:hypothetical protein